MEKKTIGAFMSALRKAKGMTQQDVADKLNVSNKAVSRWERDECAPDILLIPVIAEIFEVTCDELLKGERIFSETKEERNEPKVEKQIRSLVNREISRFKMFIYISIALSAVGLICLYCIAYGFYRPVIAFFAALIFFIASAAVSLIGTEKMKETKNGNELFESVDEKLLERFDKTLAKYSFTAFLSVVCAFTLSLPLLIFRDEYFVESVMSFGSYMLSVALILELFTLVILYAKDAYFAFITGNKTKQVSFDTEIKEAVPSRFGRMNTVQISCVIISALVSVFVPLVPETPYFSITETVFGVLGLIAVAVNVLCFFVCAVISKSERKKIIPTGLRNSVLSIAAILAANIFDISYSTTAMFPDENSVWQKEVCFDAKKLVVIVIFVLSVFIVFKIVDKIIKATPNLGLGGVAMKNAKEEKSD